MTAPNIIPVINITPPDGELFYIHPYTGETANIDEHGNVQITHDYSGLVYDSSYPLTYNVKSGILYASDVQTNDIEISTDTFTEPSDLKNTKANIRKIKQDINSKLKRV